MLPRPPEAAGLPQGGSPAKKSKPNLANPPPTPDPEWNTDNFEQHLVKKGLFPYFSMSLETPLQIKFVFGISFFFRSRNAEAERFSKSLD